MTYSAKAKLVFDLLAEYIQGTVDDEDVLCVLDGITQNLEVSDLILELFEFIKTLETFKRRTTETLRQEGLEYLIESGGGEPHEG